MIKLLACALLLSIVVNAEDTVAAAPEAQLTSLKLQLPKETLADADSKKDLRILLLRGGNVPKADVAAKVPEKTGQATNLNYLGGGNNANQYYSNGNNGYNGGENGNNVYNGGKNGNNGYNGGENGYNGGENGNNANGGYVADGNNGGEGGEGKYARFPKHVEYVAYSPISWTATEADFPLDRTDVRILFEELIYYSFLNIKYLIANYNKNYDRNDNYSYERFGEKCYSFYGPRSIPDTKYYQGTTGEAGIYGGEAHGGNVAGYQSEAAWGSNINPAWLPNPY